MDIPLDWKVIATTILVGTGTFVAKYVVGFIKAHNRVRASVHRLERGMLEQHKRLRLAFDSVRRLAFLMDRAGVPNAGRVDKLELYRIRAKVDDARDSMWAEEGNEPRRPHREED